MWFYHDTYVVVETAGVFYDKFYFQGFFGNLPLRPVNLQTNFTFHHIIINVVYLLDPLSYFLNNLHSFWVVFSITKAPISLWKVCPALF